MVEGVVIGVTVMAKAGVEKEYMRRKSRRVIFFIILLL